MVYIRNKKVKGIQYAYLVQSKWDQESNTSRQIIIKYLGRTSEITLDYIPPEYRDVPKIIAFISAYGPSQKERERLIGILQKEMFNLLKEYNIDRLVSMYNQYSNLFSLSYFYDKLLKPILYRIGDLWEKGELDVATEHACSNAASSMIKVINEKLLHKNNKMIVARPSSTSASLSAKYKIIVCTPEGELHNLACNIMESLLISKGYSVYNISPSVPASSIISYIDGIEPDMVFVSVTLKDNIKTVERLIDQIHFRYDGSRLPVVLGGAALSDLSIIQSSGYAKEHDIFLMQNASFAEIVNLIEHSVNTGRRLHTR